MGVEQPGFSVNVDADEFARILTNALAFFPARGPVEYARLTVSPDRIVSLGTDTYTMGRDVTTGVHSWNSTATAGELPIGIDLDRDGWTVLEKMIRRDKGETGRLEYRPGDALTYFPGGQGTAKSPTEIVAAQDKTGEAWTTRVHGMQGTEFWEACNDLLTRYDEPPTETPDVMCFDPSLFGRFQKVRLPKGSGVEKVLDFQYQGQDAPMLAKVGPTFVGLIMPINRDAYVENQGDESQEGLW